MQHDSARYRREGEAADRHTCMDAYTHTLTCAQVCIHMGVGSFSCAFAYMAHGPIHAHTNRHTHTQTRAHAPTKTHKHTYTHTHSRTDACTCTHIYMRTHHSVHDIHVATQSTPSHPHSLPPIVGVGRGRPSTTTVQRWIAGTSISGRGVRRRTCGMHKRPYTVCVCACVCVRVCVQLWPTLLINNLSHTPVACVSGHTQSTNTMHCRLHANRVSQNHAYIRAYSVRCTVRIYGVLSRNVIYHIHVRSYTVFELSSG